MSLDAAQKINNLIAEFVASAANSLHMDPNEPAWGRPLVGFSSGSDPLYRYFKESIGPFYWEPTEIFNKTFPGAGAEPQELTIISWVLPQTKATREANRRETAMPAERWARSRKHGEEFNVALRRYLVEVFGAQGIQAVAPQLSQLWSMHESAAFGLSSSWSERHAAYASGLGTFGLCDGLITPVGKAMRCGSVVARVSIDPTPRAYKTHREYCLFFSRGSCGVCIKRCPAGAISERGHNKKLCRAYVEEKTARFIEETWGLKSTYGCGLCQTKIPCETGIPSSLHVSRTER